MVVKRQAIKPSGKAPPRQEAAKRPFTMRHLRRMTLWGVAAVGTLFVAVLATRSEGGAQRLAAAFSSPRGTRAQLAAAHPFDARAETQHLAAAVRDLTAENSQLKSRLASVEQNLDDVTGSVTRQIEAVKAQTTWPPDATPVPLTPALIASITNPATPAPAGLAAPLPSPPQTVPAQPAAPGDASGASPTEYGVDIGSALSIQVLRARWLGVRSAHAQLFEGLAPTVVLKETPQARRVELHLVLGPLADQAKAAGLCAALAPYRLYCRATVFAPPHMALQ